MYIYNYIYTYTDIYLEFLEVLNRNSSTNTSTNQQLHQTPRHLAWAVPRSRAPQALPAESPKQRRGEQATNEAGAGPAKGDEWNKINDHTQKKWGSATSSIINRLGCRQVLKTIICQII